MCYLPPRASNFKEIEFKTFPPLFMMHGIFGQHLPQESTVLWEEEEGVCPDIYGAFQGRVALPAAPRNGFPGAADATSHPWKWGTFPGAADGTGRLWKSDL